MTYEKILLWFQTTKSNLIKLGIAQDIVVYNGDITVVEECFIPDDYKAIMINFDETNHPLFNEDDRGRPRARTYTNPQLPRIGGSSTCGSRHTTGVYGTSTLGETLPPLYIFDPAVQTDDEMRINEKSVLGLTKVRDRFGRPTVDEYYSFIDVRSSGSMDEKRFQ